MKQTMKEIIAEVHKLEAYMDKYSYSNNVKVNYNNGNVQVIDSYDDSSDARFNDSIMNRIQKLNKLMYNK